MFYVKVISDVAYDRGYDSYFRNSICFEPTDQFHKYQFMTINNVARQARVTKGSINRSGTIHRCEYLIQINN